MKKILSLALLAILGVASLFGLASCSLENEEVETVTITAYNAEKKLTEVEVPYNPERLAVLDMPSLDILDALELGDRIVGSAAVSIEYLKDYNPDDSNGKIANLGSVKTADMEALAVCEPNVIFIGGRLSSQYRALEEIAPVVYLGVDYAKGVVESTLDNVAAIATMFGVEDKVDALVSQYKYTDRVNELKNVFSGKDAVLGMYNNNSLGLQSSDSQLSILVKEIGFNNLSMTVGDTSTKPTHGEDAGWETIAELDPEYMFILDRSSAVSSADGVLGAKEVIENKIIMELDCYKNGNIVYFIEHANVWYTSTGGIQALNTMLEDLEDALASDM